MRGFVRAAAAIAIAIGLGIGAMPGPAGAQGREAGRPELGQGPAALSLGYLQLKDDSRGAPPAVYGKLDLAGVESPFQGAVLGVQDAAADTSGPVAVKLQRAEGKDAAALAAKLTAMAAAGTRLFIVDLPTDAVAALEKPAAAAGALLFNVSATDDALRGPHCAADLFNVVPSRLMLTDAIAEFLAARHWTKVLVIVGPTALDARRAGAFAVSARAFGLDVVAVRRFAGGHDPAAVLTAGADYDVVYVADSAGSFAPTLPYATMLPRPVVGDAGLTASAWSWSYLGGDAAALTLRFAALTGGRHMAQPDYAAWLAVRIVVAAARKAGSDPAAIAAYLRSKSFSIADAKGDKAHFRAEDNQLRQGVLIATPLWTVAEAPIAGVGAGVGAGGKGMGPVPRGADAAVPACRMGG